MIKTVSIQLKEGPVYGGWAIVLRDETLEYIFFDITMGKFPMVSVEVPRRDRRPSNLNLLTEKEAKQFERELFTAFFVFDVPLKIGNFDISEKINKYNAKAERELKKKRIKQVCLLVNLGGFEKKMSENIELAKGYGKTIYSLTGDGLVDFAEQPRVPVNITLLSQAELHVWSVMINEQLQQAGFPLKDVVIFAAGRNYSGTLPLGVTIRDQIRIGA